MLNATLQRLATCVVCAALLTGSAYAADLNNVEGAHLTHDWTGLYGGFTIGHASGGAAIENYNGSKDFELIDSSLTFGGHIGYNYAPFGQTQNGGFIWGMELELSGLNFDKSKTSPSLGKTSLDTSYSLAAKVRAGYAWDNFYLYGMTGLGFAEMKLNSASDKGHTLYGGLLLGAGMEYAFSDDWSMRAEGLILGLGSDNYSLNGNSYDVDHGMGTIKIGFSHKF